MEHQRTTVLQPHLQAHLGQRQALHITPVRFRRNEVALIREQKAFIEKTIAVYRMAFPDDTCIYLPFVRESEHDPGEIKLGVIQLSGETDTIRRVAASLASLLVQWEERTDLLK